VLEFCSVTLIRFPNVEPGLIDQNRRMTFAHDSFPNFNRDTLKFFVTPIPMPPHAFCGRAYYVHRFNASCHQVKRSGGGAKKKDGHGQQDMPVSSIDLMC
jgi:hypothetical protein